MWGAGERLLARRVVNPRLASGRVGSGGIGRGVEPIRSTEHRTGSWTGHDGIKRDDMSGAAPLRRRRWPFNAPSIKAAALRMTPATHKINAHPLHIRTNYSSPSDD